MLSGKRRNVLKSTMVAQEIHQSLRVIISVLPKPVLQSNTRKSKVQFVDQMNYVGLAVFNCAQRVIILSRRGFRVAVTKLFAAQFYVERTFVQRLHRTSIFWRGTEVTGGTPMQRSGPRTAVGSNALLVSQIPGA